MTVARWLLFARKDYAEPLELLRELDAGAVPTLADVEGDVDGERWLEVTAIPADAAIWVVRGGELVAELHGAEELAAVAGGGEVA